MSVLQTIDHACTVETWSGHSVGGMPDPVAAFPGPDEGRRSGSGVLQIRAAARDQALGILDRAPPGIRIEMGCEQRALG
jgi:hypothetical protein